MSKHSETYWLTEAPVSQAIWHMALPMMLGMLVNVLYSLTDTFFIGQLNSTPAMAAVTLILPVMTLFMAIGNLFGTGGSALFSRLLGAKDETMARRCCATTVWLSVFSGVICALAALPLREPIALFLGADASTLPDTTQYLLFYVIGAPVIVLNFALEQIIRGEGASVQSMVGMVLSVAVNLALDPLFLFGLHWGVGGAALATVLGNLAAVLYYLVYIRRSGKYLSASLKELSFQRTMLADIVQIGLSALLLDAFLLVSSLLLNYYAMLYGDYVLASIGISQKLVQVVDLVAMGLCLGSVPLVAAAFGARDQERQKQVIHKTAGYLTVLVLLLAGGLFLFRSPVVQCFSQDQKVLQITPFVLAVQLLSSFFAAGSELFTGIFQAEGKAAKATILAVSRGIAFVPAVILCNALWGLRGMIVSLLLSEAVAFLIGVVLVNWREKEIGQLDC